MKDKFTAALETTEHVHAKIRALREVPEISIDETVDTYEAKMGGRLIFAALRKSEGGPWITRQLRGLFTQVS